MKKLLFVCSVIYAFGLFSGCPACMRRRAEMMAKRPSLETVLPKFIKKAAAFGNVWKNFENGEYDDFFNSLHKEYLNSKSKKEFQNLLNARSSLRYHFGQSALDTHSHYPEKLQDIRRARALMIQDLHEQSRGTYLDPILLFLSKDHLSTGLVESLNALASDPNFPALDLKFCLYMHLFNLQTMRQNKPDLDAAHLHCLALDYEKLRQLEECCNQATLHHIQKIRAVLPDLARLTHWEHFLRNLAADCFKLPQDIDQKLSDVQKEYMKQRAACMRANRELLIFR